MANAQWMLEVALLLLLAATLFHALRLERALGVLKRDRAVLEELVEGFNDSTRQAENGIERLRTAADGAGRQMARQIEVAQKLRDDLNFLTDRSDRLAERLENAVRTARIFADTAQLPPGVQMGHAASTAAPQTFPLYAADSSNRVTGLSDDGSPGLIAEGSDNVSLVDAAPRLRSQAERDLLHALRASR